MSSKALPNINAFADYLHMDKKLVQWYKSRTYDHVRHSKTMKRVSMRVLHINLEPGWRGGERQTLYLMEGLRDLGCESHLMVRDNPDFIKRVSEKDFNLTVIRKPFLLSGRQLKQYGLIQLHEVRALQMAALWKSLHRRPMVFTRRVDNAPGKSWVTRYKYRQLDHLVAISNKIRTVMVNWGVPKNGISIIPSAVKLEDRSNNRNALLLKQRFQGKKAIGFIGALEARKDPMTLLNAAAIVIKNHPEVCFVFVGDGPQANQLKNRVVNLGLENQVFFEGFQKDPYAYYQIFDLLALTSISEGLGTVLLDAFYYRVPVVATHVGGIPDLVKHGETGLLAGPGAHREVAAHIERCLNSPHFTESITSAAYQRLMAYHTIPAMAGAYYKIYRRLLSKSTRI